jgi:hypothetical protein
MYYDEVLAWARGRYDHPKPVPKHFSKAPKQLWLPPAPDPPLERADQQHRIRAPRPVLNWRRPPNSKLEIGRPILATGQYATAYTPGHGIPVPDSKRGFPQPPVETSFNIHEDNDDSRERTSDRASERSLESGATAS